MYSDGTSATSQNRFFGETFGSTLDSTLGSTRGVNPARLRDRERVRTTSITCIIGFAMQNATPTKGPDYSSVPSVHVQFWPIHMGHTSCFQKSEVAYCLLKKNFSIVYGNVRCFGLLFFFSNRGVSVRR